MSFISAAAKGLSKVGGKVAKFGKSAITKLKKVKWSKFFRRGIDVTSDDTKDVENLGQASDNVELPKRVSEAEANNQVEKLLEEYDIDKDKVEENIKNKDNTVQEIIEETDTKFKDKKSDLDNKLERNEITPTDYQWEMQMTSTNGIMHMLTMMSEREEDFKDEIETFNADVVSKSFADIKTQQKEDRGILGKIYDLGKVQLLGLKQSTGSILDKINIVDVIKGKVDTVLKALELIDPMQWIVLGVFVIGTLISKFSQEIKDFVLNTINGVKNVAGNVGTSVGSWFSNSGDLFAQLWNGKYKEVSELIKGTDKDNNSVYVEVDYRKYKNGGVRVTNVAKLDKKEYDELSKDGKHIIIGDDYDKSLLVTTPEDKLDISTGNHDLRKLPEELNDTKAKKKAGRGYESQQEKRERERREAQQNAEENGDGLNDQLTPPNPGGTYKGGAKITNSATGLTGNIAYRDNNPGNLILTNKPMHGEVWPAPPLRERGSNAQIKNGFRTFKTQQDGFEAIFDNLENSRYYFKAKNNTIEGIINRWCPGSPEYISFVEKSTGINRRTPIDINNRKAMIAIATAIYKKEDIQGWKVLKPKIVSDAYDSYMSRVHGIAMTDENLNKPETLYATNTSVATQGGDILNSFNRASEANSKSFVDNFKKSSQSFNDNDLAINDNINQLQNTLRTAVTPNVNNTNITVTPPESIDMDAPGVPDYLSS